MSNVSIYVPLVDGSQFPIVDEGGTCKNIIHQLVSDDINPPPLRLVIEILTSSGKIVKMLIPYSTTDNAVVTIDGDGI